MPPSSRHELEAGLAATAAAPATGVIGAAATGTCASIAPQSESESESVIFKVVTVWWVLWWPQHRRFVKVLVMTTLLLPTWMSCSSSTLWSPWSQSSSWRLAPPPPPPPTGGGGAPPPPPPPGGGGGGAPLRTKAAPPAGGGCGAPLRTAATPPGGGGGGAPLRTAAAPPEVCSGGAPLHPAAAPSGGGCITWRTLTYLRGVSLSKSSKPPFRRSHVLMLKDRPSLMYASVSRIEVKECCGRWSRAYTSLRSSW